MNNFGLHVYFSERSIREKMDDDDRAFKEWKNKTDVERMVSHKGFCYKKQYLNYKDGLAWQSIYKLKMEDVGNRIQTQKEKKYFKKKLNYDLGFTDKFLATHKIFRDEEGKLFYFKHSDGTNKSLVVNIKFNSDDELIEYIVKEKIALNNFEILLGDGIITKFKFLEINGVTEDIIENIIKELIKKGCIEEISGKYGEFEVFRSDFEGGLCFLEEKQIVKIKSILQNA